MRQRRGTVMNDGTRSPDQDDGLERNASGKARCWRGKRKGKGLGSGRRRKTPAERVDDGADALDGSEGDHGLAHHLADCTMHERQMLVRESTASDAKGRGRSMDRTAPCLFCVCVCVCTSQMQLWWC
eukprot:984387-Rhodomonas_salina.3